MTPVRTLEVVAGQLRREPARNPHQPISVDIGLGVVERQIGQPIAVIRSALTR